MTRKPIPKIMTTTTKRTINRRKYNVKIISISFIINYDNDVGFYCPVQRTGR